MSIFWFFLFFPSLFEYKKKEKIVCYRFSCNMKRRKIKLYPMKIFRSGGVWVKNIKTKWIFEEIAKETLPFSTPSLDSFCFSLHEKKKIGKWDRILRNWISTIDFQAKRAVFVNQTIFFFFFSNFVYFFLLFELLLSQIFHRGKELG